MSDSVSQQSAADKIWDSINSKETCKPIRDIIGEANIDAAYEIQQINTNRKLANGEQIIGYKVGLTSFAVQKQLGVDQPDFGVLTKSMLVSEEEQVPMSALMQPKAEAEIGFVLSQAIDEKVETIFELTHYIEYACASIEIVGSRIEGWDIRITDTIADNASASHFVVGKSKVQLADVDLVQCKMSMTKNGEIISTGQGRACMDNPLNAALWLVNTMVERGASLKKGDVILSGALGPMVPVIAGDRFIAEIEGLGTVSVSFEN
jgi:2-keto-4-pentenoate hydratase